MDEASRKEALAKLEGMNDPLRMMILTALILKPASASDLAAELDLPIGRVRYQLGRLRQAGLAELRERRPKRGVVERVYSITPHFISVEDASHLTTEEMNRGHVEILKGVVRDALAALRTGTFGSREEFMAARAPLRLDEEGWRQAADLQQRTLDRLLEIHAESLRRIDSGKEEAINAIAALFLFEMAPPEKPDKSSGKSEFESGKTPEA